MRVLQIIVVGISALSTSFAQQHRYRSNSPCSAADQISCCEMMLDRLEGARNFCNEHGCNQNICSGKPSGSGYDDDDTRRVGVGVGVKKDDKDEDNDDEHDHDNYVDLWESGGATQWGKNEDGDNAWGVDKWSKDKDKVGSDRAASASTSTVLPSRQRQQRHLAWSPTVWDAPKYTEPKTYYPPPAYYYYPPPPAPKFVETCCTSGEKFCPMEFPMEKQVLLSGKVRVCCFTSRVDGGGRYYPYSYGGGGYYRGGGYQTRTSHHYGGGGYGNRKLKYGGGGIYGQYQYQYQQPSYYGDSYGFPAQCPPPQSTRVPTRLPTTPAPTPGATTTAPTLPPTLPPTPPPTLPPTLPPTPPPSTPSPTPCINKSSYNCDVFTGPDVDCNSETNGCANGQPYDTPGCQLAPPKPGLEVCELYCQPSCVPTASPTPPPTPEPTAPPTQLECFPLDPNPYSFETPNDVFPKAPWTTRGDGEWSIDNARSHTGEYSIRSPNFDGSPVLQISNATLAVCDDYKGGPLTFQVLASVLLPQDIFIVYVDGTVAAQIMDVKEFTEVKLALTPGPHRVDFSYRYNPFNLDPLPGVPPEILGAVWLDSVSLGTPPPS